MSELLKSAYYWIYSELFTLLGFLLALIFIAHLVRQRRSPTSTFAWLLVVILLPYIGVPLYLMLGGRKMSRMAGRKAPVYHPFQAPHGNRQDGDIERLLLSYGVPRATPNHRVDLATTGEEAYRRLVRMIEEARLSIHITTYILGQDNVGKALVALLTRRASEGVTVRLLLDDVGSWWLRRKFLAPLIAAGARVAYFMPMLHIPFRGRANLRNHRKLVVVDGRIALTGGINLAWPYIGPPGEPGLWCDMAVVVEGQAVRDLDALFASDWEFATGEAIALDAPSHEDAPAATSSLVQVVASGPDVSGDPLYESLLSLIFSARERIWIVTPYFVPDEMLARALNLAARRGIDVRLILPARSNHVSADLARASYLRDLHDAGGLVLLYRPVMLHAKAILFDNQLAVIGSANMDIRSLLLNYEVSLFLYSPHEVEAVSQWARRLLADCVPELPKAGWTRQLAEDVVRLFSPLL